jgi:hypothetical protein
MYKPAMKDMSLPKRKSEEVIAEPSPEKYEGPRYPWGLCMSLSQDEIKKLGIDFESIDVGSAVQIAGVANVTSKSSNESDKGEPTQRIELQVTHLSVDPGTQTEKDNRAEGRYKEK